MRIAHLADVHIRGLSRHDEVRDVFDAFVSKISHDCIEHVMLAGDVFHTKTSGISPESIELMTEVFSKISDVSELHMILGNHDGSLVNSTRQDAISPIVNAMNNPKIHLYKKSGVYEFAPGFNWCVFSIFDEEGWSNVKPIPGAINIACYHGPVFGSQTEVGWSVDDGLNVDFFSDYSFTMLGDIHLSQFLKFRDVVIEIDEEELSKYPGAEVISKR